MKYPSITQYIDSIDSGRDFFLSLGDVALCRAADWQPIFRSGNFGVVFKVLINGRARALKCFTREQHGRAKAYAAISGNLPRSDYMIDFRFLDNELTAFLASGVVFAYPVLDMEWVEGSNMDQVIRQACRVGDRATLAQLSERFDTMARWLLTSDFAHGDLKPENIIITNEGHLRLVDYDGVYLPWMQGELQREVGTPAYQHPLRGGMTFGTRIDEYSIALISLTLRALSLMPELLDVYGEQSDGLLLNPERVVGHRSEVIEFLSTTSLGDSLLMTLVESPLPELSGLAQALDQSLPQSLAQCDLVPFERNGSWGYMSDRGEMIAPRYERAMPFCEGLAAVRLGGKWGYIDCRAVALSSFKFDDAWSFAGGRALIRRGDKYGFLGPDGRMAIPARFDFARNFSESLAVAAVDGAYGFIDLRGRWAIRPQYDYAESFRQSVARVEKDGRPLVVSLSDVKRCGRRSDKGVVRSGK